MVGFFQSHRDVFNIVTCDVSIFVLNVQTQTYLNMPSTCCNVKPFFVHQYSLWSNTAFQKFKEFQQALFSTCVDCLHSKMINGFEGWLPDIQICYIFQVDMLCSNKGQPKIRFRYLHFTARCVESVRSKFL